MGEITIEEYEILKKSNIEELLLLKKLEEKEKLKNKKDEYKNNLMNKIRNLNNGFKILLTIVLVILLTLMGHGEVFVIRRGEHFIRIVLNDGLFTLSFFTLIFYSIFWGIKKEPN